MERTTGIEPAFSAWEADALPLNYVRILDGAGDGNRTHVTSLEGWNSTIELHPHAIRVCSSQRILLYHKQKRLSSIFFYFYFAKTHKYIPDVPPVFRQEVHREIHHSMADAEAVSKSTRIFSSAVTETLFRTSPSSMRAYAMASSTFSRMMRRISRAP